jgi:hypothetical protein
VIEAAGKYTQITRNAERGTRNGGLNIVVKERQVKPLDAWGAICKEFKDGGHFSEYVRMEKATAAQRYRGLAKKMHGFEQNNKSEFRRLADIPARDYYRWLREDPDFWNDNKNLKSLRRDNPDVCVYL